MKLLFELAVVFFLAEISRKVCLETTSPWVSPAVWLIEPGWHVDVELDWDTGRDGSGLVSRVHL